MHVRNAGAIASGLSLTLSMAWHRAQWRLTSLKPRRCEGDSAKGGSLADGGDG